MGQKTGGALPTPAQSTQLPDLRSRLSREVIEYICYQGGVEIRHLRGRSGEGSTVLTHGREFLWQKISHHFYQIALTFIALKDKSHEERRVNPIIREKLQRGLTQIEHVREWLRGTDHDTTRNLEIAAARQNKAYPVLLSDSLLNLQEIAECVREAGRLLAPHRKTKGAARPPDTASRYLVHALGDVYQDASAAGRLVGRRRNLRKLGPAVSKTEDSTGKKKLGGPFVRFVHSYIKRVVFEFTDPLPPRTIDHHLQSYTPKIPPSN